MYLGLWVLWAETRWIAGPDIGYQRRLTLMRRRQGAIQEDVYKRQSRGKAVRRIFR